MAARSTTWNSLRSESARVNGHSYEVTSAEVISKDARSPSVLQPCSPKIGRPHLVRVTCEDYDPATGHYASNVVVTLDPVR